MLTCHVSGLNIRAREEGVDCVASHSRSWRGEMKKLKKVENARGAGMAQW